MKTYFYIILFSYMKVYMIYMYIKIRVQLGCDIIRINQFTHCLTMVALKLRFASPLALPMIADPSEVSVQRSLSV